jgi:hypothetical protein
MAILPTGFSASDWANFPSLPSSPHSDNLELRSSTGVRKNSHFGRLASSMLVPVGVACSAFDDTSIDRRRLIVRRQRRRRNSSLTEPHQKDIFRVNPDSITF